MRSRPGPKLRSILLCTLLVGCEEEHTLEPTVNARPGIEQVGSADGPLVDEDEACGRLKQALDGAKADNDCEEVSVPECPGLVRPGGSLACVRYAEESVDACVERVQEYDACSDFVREACVVVAVVNEMSEDCELPGAPVGDAGTDAGSGPGATDDAGSEPDEVDSGAAFEDAGPEAPTDPGTPDASAGDAGQGDGTNDAGAAVEDSGANPATDSGSMPLPDSGLTDGG